jgi:hypothetical protein
VQIDLRLLGTAEACFFIPFYLYDAEGLRGCGAIAGNFTEALKVGFLLQRKPALGATLPTGSPQNHGSDRGRLP